MAPLKILAVEDDEVVRKLIGVGLRDEERFELRTATDGEAGLVAYKEFRPDIILLDLLLPHMNGFSVLETIRTTLGDRRTTIIMVSSVSEKNDIVACARLGIQGYVVKPFQAKTLAETILQYHQQAQAARAKTAKG